jgi:1-acyl-sn-glycerol-3-phosphate acyltransferase
MIRSHFRKVTIHGEFYDRDLPVMLIGNHFSWWDGFFANLLNIRVFHRRFHIMMLEGQLGQRMFLNRAGAYSINKGHRSLIESLNYTADLLTRKENLVVLYPQGVFESLNQRPVTFQRGIERIAAGVKNDIHLVFYAALTDYFSFRKPSVDIYIEEFPKELALAKGSLEPAYNEFLSRCVNKQKPG